MEIESLFFKSFFMYSQVEKNIVTKEYKNYRNLQGGKKALLL